LTRDWQVSFVIAEHLLAQAADDEPDLDRLKSLAFAKLVGNNDQLPNQAA
jgi:hypothetical protein